MSLIWAEGFDQYGNSLTDALNGGYAAFQGANLVLDNSAPRTGGWCVRSTRLNQEFFRRILDNATDVLGVGLGFRFDLAPDGSGNPWDGDLAGVTFETNGGAGQRHISFVPSPSLAILCIDRNNGNILGQTQNNIITLGAYYWWEMAIDRGTGVGDGTLQLRINGQTALIINNSSFVPTSFDSISIGSTAVRIASAPCDWRADDFVIWDGVGTSNNSFLGNRRCYTLFPSADGGTMNWTPSSGGTGFNLIDNAPPNDAEYIAANTAPLQALFDHGTLGVYSSDVAGVRVGVRAQQTSAGSSTLLYGIDSSGHIDAASVVPNLGFGYTNMLSEVNPNGNVRWTKASVEASLLYVERIS